MARVSTVSRSTAARRLSATLALVALSVSLATVTADVAQGADEPRPTVGLVNEDLAAEFNGDSYTLGTSFVDRISSDSDYNWIVLSRSVAEKAYNDGSLEAILYIPQSFTRDILTFQDLAPTKATIEYKLEPQADQRADQLLDSKIGAIVDGFNESVIKMYYASVADSLADADGYLHANLSNQEALIAALTADVQEPFSSTIPAAESFVSSASSLKGVNAASVEAQNLFSKSVTNALDSNSDALTGQLPKIDEYTKRQREIAQINTSNGNKAIADQAASDLSYYGSQFEGFRTSTLCALSGLDAADLPAPCALPDGTVPPHLSGRISELKQTIAHYTTDHTLAVDNLRADLDTRVQNLRAVEALLVGATVPVDPAVLASLEQEILALESTRDSLTTTLPVPMVDSALANVDAWYSETITRIKDASLTPNTVASLVVNDWSSYDPDSSALYVDGSDELHTSITGLVSQAAETSSQIASSAATVPDNSSQFDALLQSATTTVSSSESVFTGLNELLATGATGLDESQSYYANFSTVLANTRAQGVDTGSIYDFFAAPIEAKNITPQRPAIEATVGFDIQWVAVFGGGLLAGVLAAILAGVIRRRKTA